MATLVFDQFTDADNTALTAHTPNVGGAWTAAVGTLKIVSNKATPNSDADDDQAVTDAGQSDFTLSCDVAATAVFASYNRAASLMVRWSDSTHFWLVDINVSGIAANTVVLYQKNGTYSSVASANPAIVSGVPRTFTISCLGPLLSVYVDGTLQFSYSSATMNQTSTKVGLRLGSSGVAVAKPTWDNLLVLTPAAVQIPPARLAFGPTRLLGLTGLPVIAYPQISPPSLNSVDVQKYAPERKQRFPTVPVIGLTGLPTIFYPPNNPAPPPPPQVYAPPVVLGFGPTRLLGLTGLPVTPTVPGAKPPAPPTPPSGPSHNLGLIERVPENSDQRRLARHTDKVVTLLNSLIRQGVVVQTAPGEWKLVAPSGPPTPPATGLTGTFP